MIVERLLHVALLGSAWVLYLLLALSVVSIAAMLERWLFFRRHADDLDALRRRLDAALQADDLESARAQLARSRSLEARVLLAALPWREGGPEAFSDAVESELGRARRELERGLNLLGTLGNNAPFVGLLGTVIGVIDAFNHLGAGAARGGAGGMGNVMSGIAEALVATGVGLFVAIPAVVGYNIAQARIGATEANAHSLGKLFAAYLRTAERSAASHARQPRWSRADAPHANDDREAGPEVEISAAE